MPIAYPIAPELNKMYGEGYDLVSQLLGNIFDPRQMTQPPVIPGAEAERPKGIGELMAGMMISPSAGQALESGAMGLGGVPMMAINKNPSFNEFIENSLFNKRIPELWDQLKGKAQYKSINGDQLVYLHKSTKSNNTQQASIFDNLGPVGDIQIPIDKDVNEILRRNNFIPMDYQKIVVKGGLGKPSANYAGFGWEPVAPGLTKVWIGPKEFADWMRTRLESGGYLVELNDIVPKEKITEDILRKLYETQPK